jgi:hypothetical protein
LVPGVCLVAVFGVKQPPKLAKNTGGGCPVEVASTAVCDRLDPKPQAAEHGPVLRQSR